MLINLTALTAGDQGGAVDKVESRGIRTVPMAAQLALNGKGEIRSLGCSYHSVLLA